MEEIRIQINDKLLEGVEEMANICRISLQEFIHQAIEYYLEKVAESEIYGFKKRMYELEKILDTNDLHELIGMLSEEDQKYLEKATEKKKCFMNLSINQI